MVDKKVFSHLAWGIWHPPPKPTITVTLIYCQSLRHSHLHILPALRCALPFFLLSPDLFPPFNRSCSLQSTISNFFFTSFTPFHSDLLFPQPLLFVFISFVYFFLSNLLPSLSHSSYFIWGLSGWQYRLSLVGAALSVWDGLLWWWYEPFHARLMMCLRGRVWES